MKILYCSDLHGNKELYEKLFTKGSSKDIHAVVIGGDICPHFHGAFFIGIKFQRDFLEKWLVPKIKDFKKDVFMMMGNDDFKANMDILEKAQGANLKLLHKKMHRLGKYSIVGYGFVPPMPFLLKDWEKLDDKDSKQITNPEFDVRSADKEEGTIYNDLEKLKKLSDPKETIYITHSPPFDTKLDMTIRKEHVGSRAIKEFINREQPPLTLHGHIHEGPQTGSWKDKIGSTICLNPGSSHLEDKLNIVTIDLENFDARHEVI